MKYSEITPEATLAREFVQTWDKIMNRIDYEPLKYIPPLIDAIADLGAQTPTSVRSILMELIPSYGKDTITELINLHYHIDGSWYDHELPFK